MPEKHALLSASGSHRWLHCTPSARLEQEFEDQTSEAAAEGTAAHALAEYKLKRALKMRAKRPISEYEDEAMDVYTDAYVSFVIEKLEEAKKLCKDPTILVEQQLDYSDFVPEGFGTGDAVIVGDKRLYIIDLKYGQGVVVEAESNTQMMLYALGAWSQLHALYEIEEVSMSIFQPRRENISTWVIRIDELLHWANEVLLPKAQEAFNGEGEFCSGEWCRFCKAKKQCRARADKYLELARHEFKLPPLMDDSEIEAILPVLESLKSWANEIMNYVEATAINEGRQWAGYKLVEGRSIRKYSDEAKVAEEAKKAGYTDIYKTSLISVAEMEKLMGKKTFSEVLGPYINKPRGKLTLVPESDKRKAVNTAASDFKDD